MSVIKSLIALALFGLTGITGLAQAACPALVQEALEFTDRICSDTQRNQACYGNLQIQAVPQPDAALKFDAPGDIADLLAIQALNLSVMTAPSEWGVALLSVQANLPDGLPGQNVTMLLLGDVAIENRGRATAPLAALDVTANNTINVRSGPGTGNSIVGKLSRGQTLAADARNAAGDWLRVRLDEATTGWVAASLVTAAGDTAVLAVVADTGISGITYGPMQAFYFTSGTGNPQCSEAPQDGILIQTPGGAGEVELVINEVSVTFGSTAFLQAQPDTGETEGRLRVLALEGHVTLKVQDSMVSVPAGAAGIVPLDANGLPDGSPTAAGYTAADTAGLDAPVGILPEAIAIAPGLTPDQLVVWSALATSLPGVTPVDAMPHAGRWRVTLDAAEKGCGEIVRTPTGSVHQFTQKFSANPYIQVVDLADGQALGFPVTGAGGVYSGEQQREVTTSRLTLVVTSDTTLTGTYEVSSLRYNCSVLFTFTAAYVE